MDLNSRIEVLNAAAECFATAIAYSGVISIRFVETDVENAIDAMFEFCFDRDFAKRIVEKILTDRDMFIETLSILIYTIDTYLDINREIIIRDNSGAAYA